MHTIYPVTENSDRTNLVRNLIARTDRVRVIGVATLLALTFLLASVPAHYEPLQGTFLALSCSAAMVGTFPAVNGEPSERMLGGIYQDRRDVALLIVSVAVFLAIWLGVEVSTWN